MRQYFDFSGKVALITGGSRGLGLAIATAFAEQGASVIVASRKAEACHDVAAALSAANGGRRMLGIGAHAGKWEDLDRLADAAYENFGRVDILVNNAGMSPLAASSFETSEALFDKVVEVNFKGPFRLASIIGNRMMAGDGGSIINITSIGAIRPQPAYVPYAGAKAALNAATIAHAFEFAPKVRVNAIMPGSFRTDVAKHWDPAKEAATPAALKRFGEPEEIVSTVLYLASDFSSFTTGAILGVDGGRP